MQDSSTNPYIPQESDAIRAKVYQHQSPLGRVVKLSLIATAIVAVLVGIGLFFVAPLTTAVDEQARIKLANALQPPDQTLKRIDVQSQLGFKLNYDNRVYSSYAEVGDSTAGTEESVAVLAGETYENNDLRIAREYNYVRIRPIESVESSRSLTTLPPELEIFATTSDADLEKALTVPENKGLSKMSLFIKLDGDKREAKKVADDNTIVSIEASRPVSATIGSVSYQKVRYTTTNDNYRISNVKYDECYYTIQFDQPYTICVSDVRPNNVSAASLVELIFDSVVFEQSSVVPSSSTEESSVDSDTTSYVLPLAKFAQSTTEDSDSSEQTESTTTSGEFESPLITVTPEYYKNADSLKAIAKNQPSVVRIGTLYCAELALKFESGETATNLTDACMGNVATGVFVSEAGYIATTGHAIRTQKKAAINGYINFAPDRDQMLDRLDRVLDYLLEAKIMLESDAEYIRTGAAIGDQEALAKVENITSVIPDNFITAVKEEYTYAVQPTDKPIVINRNDVYKPSFAYSDSVLSAKYVGSNYDATKSIQEEFNSVTPSEDVGLLKVDGTFPEVSIASTEDAKANDTLNIIGYPAYTDSSLTIDRVRNLPIATVTKVDQAYDKEGRQLIQTNLPVLPGNDGAPVFNASGKLMGFAVYGLTYCPDELCFANGTVRSSAELLKLVSEDNITLATGSESAAKWSEGVDTYMQANYAASASSFKSAGSLYAFNRWADPAQKLAVANQGTKFDTSLMNQLQIIMIIVLSVLVVVTIILTVLYVLHRQRISMLQVGHYGAASPAPTPLVANPPLQQQTQAPVALPPVQPQNPYVQSQQPQQFQPQQPMQQQPPQSESPVIQLHGEQTPQPPVQPTQQPTQPQQNQPAAPPNPPEDPFYK